MTLTPPVTGVRTPLPPRHGGGNLRACESGTGSHDGPRRLDELVLEVRTFTWLCKLLWRPALLTVVGRTRRLARR